MGRGGGNPLELKVERRFPGRSPSDVYAGVEAWLKPEGASITVAEAGSRLVAKHGRRAQPKGWAKNARKTLEFTFLPAGEGCVAAASVRPAAYNEGDLIHMLEAAHANWSELLEDLWASLGTQAGAAPYARLAPQDWGAVLETSGARMRRGRLVTVLALAGMFLLIALSPSAGFFLTRGQATLILAVPGFLMLWSLSEWIMGWLRMREARRALSGKRE